jgi:outer membrane translocation and assembly module TamA
MGSRRLPEGQLLYRGAKLELKKTDKNWPTEDLKTASESVVSVPVRNKTLLGFSAGLWIYTHFKEKTWIHRKFAKEPVLFAPNTVTTTEGLLENRAFNHGYFESKVESEVKINKKKKTVKVEYTLTVLSPPHRLRNIEYLPATDDLTRRILKEKPNALLKTDAVYQLDGLSAERDRLAIRLRNDGYHQFNADYLFFEADTTVGNRRIDLNLKIKPSAPAKAFFRYRVDSISVFPNLSNINDTTYRSLLFDSGECVEFRGLPGDVPYDMLRKTLCFKCGDYYSGAAHEATLAYLFHLNVFKFANIRFEPDADSSLAVDIRLIPYKRHKIKLYGNLVYSPQLYWGGDFGLTYDNRNLFGNAELLHIEASAQPLSVPADAESDQSDLNIMTLDFEATLTTPRLRPPKFKPDGSIYAPLFQNKYTAGYTVSRYALFDGFDIDKYGVSLHEITLEGGRVMKNSNRPTITHEFNPISLGTRFTTAFPNEFEDIFSAIVQLDTASNVTYAPQIYFEPNYTFLWDNRFKTSKSHQTFLRNKLTLRGGAFFDSPYTPPSLQGSRSLVSFLENDFRKFFDLDKRSVLAGKILFNAALPLNAASVNTFSINDLYIVGGANSVRAFAPRTIGPGSVPPDAGSDLLAISNHVGNFLLETSLEYRRRWNKNWEWAAFIDAGNIWTYEPIPGYPGADFKFNRFYKELAVGAGFGLRYGISFLVVRLDVAMPIVKPWLAEGERWVLGDIELFSSTWRKDNLLLNFSIGYPF